MGPDSQSEADSLFSTLQEMLTVPWLTAQDLLRITREHPGALGEEAQRLLSFIEQAQTAPAARAQVRKLALLLASMAEEGPEKAIADERIRVTQHTSESRRIARLSKARQEFRQKWRQTPADAVTISSDPSLPSLSQRVEELMALSRAERIQPHGRNILAAEGKSASLPAYLFRGESGAWPETRSALGRVRAQLGKASATYACLASLCASVGDALHQQRHLPLIQAIGFLQHYGLPTEFIDATANPNVAASFACALKVGEVGKLCIIPTDKLVARAELSDLRWSGFAKRARLQSAFAIHSNEYPDLKEHGAVAALGLRWLPFRLTREDAERFEPDFALLDARSDEIAGLIWILLDHFAKFDDEAASMLANRIDPAPLYAVAGADGHISLVAEDLAGTEPAAVSDEDFRQAHYMKWSVKFPEPETKSPPPELQAHLKTAAEIETGAIIRLLTPKALGLQ